MHCQDRNIAPEMHWLCIPTTKRYPDSQVPGPDRGSLTFLWLLYHSKWWNGGDELKNRSVESSKELFRSKLYWGAEQHKLLTYEPWNCSQVYEYMTADSMLLSIFYVPRSASVCLVRTKEGAKREKKLIGWLCSETLTLKIGGSTFWVPILHYTLHCNSHESPLLGNCCTNIPLGVWFVSDTSHFDYPLQYVVWAPLHR